MKPGRFDYHLAETAEHALELLARHGDEAKVLAGGQSLVPAMNFRLAMPAVLVDINRIPGFDRVYSDGRELVIEMLVRHRDLETPATSDALGRALAAVARFVGHLPIRVRGTFAGSIAHADPAAEWCAVLCALSGSVVAQSVRGSRRIPASRFFEGAFTTALEPDELITEVRLPLLDGARASFHEKSHTAGDFATVAVFAAVAVDAGRVSRCLVGVAGAQAHPLKLHETERQLIAAAPDRDAIAAAAEAGAASLDPISDAQCSSDYRRHLVRVLTKRALHDAILEPR